MRIRIKMGMVLRGCIGFIYIFYSLDPLFGYQRIFFLNTSRSIASATVSKGSKLPVQKAGGKKKKVNLRFIIDCSKPVEDGIMQADDFEAYLRSRIKVNGRTSSSGQPRHFKFERQKYKLVVMSEIPFSKRYLKYLTKKYLKKNNLRDWLRVVSASKDSYELRYYQINNEEDEDEDEAE
ncbi:60S ribosomal protein L22 [Fragariocoptes setiger]|uniref:Large ribosomal subunit protein eL22 n=1 Tax=Fragariocoptes setiger TaxID=1670756 RepID=A0ABQ7SC08_9ACAR|nr:60S ribosomal protein L22 [Fragariocoptes setiger]